MGKTECWFAVQVKSRCESTVARVLRNKTEAVFAPIYESIRVRPNGQKMIQQPLVPGYVFSRFDVEHRLPVLTTPYVMSIVSFGRQPVPIDPIEIENLQRAASSPHQCQPWMYLKVGQKARIISGPLAGVEGILVDDRKAARLVLSIELLQRAVAVEVPSKAVAPIG
jgi:transcription antitermination factor NusG